MRYVSVIMDYTYLLWQQEVQIHNFKKLGLLDQLTVVILVEKDKEPSEHARKVASMADTHFFENLQARRTYIPSNKPYGLARLLEKHPEHGNHLFLLDSDVIFREPVDFAKLNMDDSWYFSNTVGYLGWEYLTSYCKLTREEIAQATAIVGVDVEVLEREQENSGGAQYYMKGVDAAFCDKVAENSIDLYHYLCSLPERGGAPQVQVWTAEMWSWLWNAFMRAQVIVHPEMDFAWATDHITMWDKRKIFHLSGVTANQEGAFYKGKYPFRVPWEVEPDFAFVSRDRCWWRYVEEMLEYRDSQK